MHHKRGLKILLAILTIIILAGAVYFTFFFSYSCDSFACYRSHQEKCAKTKFLYEGADANWLYKIKGSSDKSCEIEVTLLNLRQGSADQSVLEGKEMICYLPYGSIVNPEKDLTLCHGLLKEDLQNLIIQKLHRYIFENVGEISSELSKAI